MASDGDWGDTTDGASQDRHDKWHNLPSLSDADSPALDRFLAERKLNKDDLARVGARWEEPDTLAFFFPDSIKYRRVTDGKRWNERNEWRFLKVVRRTSPDGPRGIIVAEGETDAASLSKHFRDWDVGVLPAGAKGHTEQMLGQLRRYDRVVLALDADQAGDEGADRIRSAVPGARRLRPPDGSDWCAEHSAGRIEFTDPWEAADPPPKSTFSIRELLDTDLGEYQDAHYFDQPILPLRGCMVLHGAMKSLKSFVLDDLLRALATGTTFADRYGYVHPEPAKAVLVQYEIPPWDFQNRMAALAQAVPHEHKDAFLDNMFVYHIADNAMPRLKVGPTLLEQCLAIMDESGAEVIALDPIQRMLGSASADRAEEVDPLLEVVSELQGHGYTVVYCHHNNKSGGRKSKDPLSMAGTQRFGADVDSVASLWQSEGCVEDDNIDNVKQRNCTWTLRNGVARGFSVTTRPNLRDPELAEVTFDDVIYAETTDDPNYTSDF